MQKIGKKSYEETRAAVPLPLARAGCQLQNCGNVPISEEVHFDQFLSALLTDIPALSLHISPLATLRRPRPTKIARRGRPD